ncbi:65kDa B protein-domain-containing protein [Nemania serpens]|nr:65kDa B protein-domain-containing protein [Nemania serpens]
MGFHHLNPAFSGVATPPGASLPLLPTGHPISDPATGALIHTVSVPTSPGRGGIGPSLQLTYDSNASNGAFGLGWRLSSECIERKTSSGIPQYCEQGQIEDIFVLSGYDDLVPIYGPQKQTDGWGVHRYTPRVLMGDMIVIERWTNLGQIENVHWRTISSSNVTTLFGVDDYSRISNPTEGRPQIFSWLASEQYDDRGNAMRFSYKAEDLAGVAVGHDHPKEHTNVRHLSAQRYPKRILYCSRVPTRNLKTWEVDWSLVPQNGWMFEVVFDYGEHDASSPTSQEQTPWLVRKEPFSTRLSGFEVRTYRLCQRILMFHHIPEEFNGVEEVLVSSMHFEYDEASLPDGTALLSTITHMGNAPELTQESLPPQVFHYSSVPDLSSCVPVDVDSVQGPAGSSGRHAHWVDLDSEGAVGLLHDIDGDWWYQRNESPMHGNFRLAAPRLVKAVPGLQTEGWFYLRGQHSDGELGLCCRSDSTTNDPRMYFTRTQEGGWTSSLPSSFPNIDLEDPGVLMIDLTGDGNEDLLCFNERDRRGAWYPSLGKGGFSDEAKPLSGISTPVLRLEDPAFQVIKADMTGDGLEDIVIVQDGRVSYWPNQGHGHFGQIIEMGNGPRAYNGFDAHQLLLVDVTGSGTTDLIHFHGTGGLTVYYNCAGNRWSDGYIVESFPDIPDRSSIFAIDLSGQGTACLCFSDPARLTGHADMKCLDLMCGEHRPGLLRKYSNGIGLETTISYATSTKFYLQAEFSGAPWATRLPFATQCVEYLRTDDHIANTSSTIRYFYHDGYYDWTYGEFRGFGSVEQWNRTTVPTSADVSFSVPSTHLRTWFHLGRMPGYNDFPKVEKQLLEMSLAQPVTAEAYRCFKGLRLREELYRNDQAKWESTPSQTWEQNYESREVYLGSKTQPGVYRVLHREMLVLHSNLSKDNDPQLSHEMVLQVNDHGQTIKSASIAYGRMASPLPDICDAKKQAETVIIYSETNYSNLVDDGVNFRVPLRCESKNYRILGSKQKGLYRFEDLANHDCSFFTLARESDLDDTDDSSDTRRRVLSDASTTRILKENGGYQDLDGDNHWWVPSSRTRFSTATDSSTNELEAARRSFYTPISIIDAFGFETRQEFDSYHLLATSTVDAVGNQTSFSNNYRVLEHEETIDPNGNRKKAAFDTFGRTIGIVVKGKETEVLGDSLDEFQLQPTEEELEQFIQNPSIGMARSLLGKAGVRILHGTNRYWRAVSQPRMTRNIYPTFQATIARHTHSPETSRLMIVITYLDGMGRPIQQASPATGGKWRMSGWHIYDAQERLVRHFLPFFATSHQFLFQPLPSENSDKSVTFFWDSLGRSLAVLRPDHGWTKTRHAPWSVEHFNAGDTILVPDPARETDVGAYFKDLDPNSYLPTWYTKMSTTVKSQIYDDTPTIIHLDASGSPIVVIQNNGNDGLYTSRYEYDLLGNRVKVTNALGTIVTKTSFDMLSRPLRVRHMDDGTRYFLPDCLGRPMLAWDSEGKRRRMVHDAVGRLKEDRLLVSASSAQGDQAGTPEEKVVTKLVYGEGQPHDRDNNLRGQLYRCYDQAGLTTYAAFEFKGNCVKVEKKVAEEYNQLLDWSPKSSPKLEAVAYVNTAQFNALNQGWKTVAPDGSVTIRGYGDTGELTILAFQHTTSATTDTCISGIGYSADGRRERVGYGNGVLQKNTFHPETRDLVHSVIKKVTGNQRTFRDASYNYDCESRITHKSDAARQDVFLRENTSVPSQDFAYDAIGEITSSRGRERANVRGRQLLPYSSTYITDTLPGDGKKMYEYIETYQYDPAGNIVALQHDVLPNGGKPIRGWMREYFYKESSCIPGEASDNSNRLSYTTVDKDEEMYTYNGHGCMLSLPGHPSLTWDFNDHLCSSSATGSNETTWYVYDAGSRLSRKVIEGSTQSSDPSSPPIKTRIAETIYLPGYHIHRRFSDDGQTLKEQTMTSLVLEDQMSNPGSYIALFEYQPKTQSMLKRYKHGEDLELSEKGDVLSYTEY